MSRHIQTTNAIEGFFSHVRQRSDQIDAFTTEMSCLTIVWAVMQDIRFHNIAGVSSRAFHREQANSQLFELALRRGVFVF
jgi:transposase-like protein